MNKRLEQGKSARQRIVDVAATMFARAGYEATSIAGVLAESGVSRGALYHHFDSKEALFEAVLDQVEKELASEILAAAGRSRDPVESLRAGCVQFLRLAGKPAVRQVMLIDAPTAVGWRRWREIDARHGFGLMKFSLAAAASSGRIDPELADMYAHVILVSVMELALLVAGADDYDGELARAEKAINTLIEGLKSGR